MSDSIFTRAFWSATGERAVKTLAQTAASVLITAGVSGALDADWKGVASASALAAIISVLTSVAGNAVTKTGPSFGNAEQVVPAESEKAAAIQASGTTEARQRDPETGRWI